MEYVTFHNSSLFKSSFTHPQVVSNLYEFISSDEYKIRYFKERLQILKKYFFPLTAWLQTSFKIFSFVFSRMQFIQVL